MPCTRALSCAQALERLSRLERHIRKKRLKLMSRDELDKSHESSRVDDRHVRKMAAFLFWNITQSVDACSMCHLNDDIAALFKEDSDVDLYFWMLDINGDGKITKEDCLAAVEKIHEDP